MTDCLFCKIVTGEVPSDPVRDGERTYAFRDIAPAAPTHVLVVPKRHIPNAVDLVAQAPELLTTLIEVAGAIAVDEGLAAGGYRLVFNTGRNGGQTVDHVHLHLLGGRAMTWPPG